MRIVSLLLWFGLIASAHAGIVLLGRYEFEGTSTGDNQFNSISSPAAGVTFSDVTRVNVSWNSGANVFNSRDWNQGAAVDPAEYVQFSISADPGYSILLDRIVFSARRSSTGPGSGEVRAFSEANPTAEAPAQALFSYSPPTTSSIFTFDFLDFSTAEGGSATFRFYGFGAGGSSGTLNFDNIELYGNTDLVPVPEPIEWALAIFGGVFVAGQGIRTWFKRRHKPCEAAAAE
jgi:hypothetical protein